VVPSSGVRQPLISAATASGLLAVDQQLGEGAGLRVPPIGANRVGAVEVGKHEDAEQLGAGSGTEGVQVFPESALKLVGSQGRRLRRPTVAPRSSVPIQILSRNWRSPGF
jgi:hypothetical protein